MNDPNKIDDHLLTFRTIRLKGRHVMYRCELFCIVVILRTIIIYNCSNILRVIFMIEIMRKADNILNKILY